MFAVAGVSGAEPSGSETTEEGGTTGASTVREGATTSQEVADSDKPGNAARETTSVSADRAEDSAADSASEEGASPQELEDALNGVAGKNGTPSQGSLRGGSDGPVLPDAPAYSEVVDNTSADKFEAPGWRTSGEGKDIYGNNYRTPGGGGGSAKYEFEVPATDVYTVFAWWPSVNGAGSGVQVETQTGDGIERETVDQTEDGGYWVPVGQYKMVKGDRRTVEISGGGSGAGGKVIADAMAVVRGISAVPEDPKKIGNNSLDKTAGGEETFQGAGRWKRIPSRSLMKRGRQHLGTRYVYGGRSVCRVGVSMDCSCFTQRVYAKYRWLPDSPRGLWRKNGQFISRRNLQQGDVVIFDENRNNRMEPWDHVGMYAGNGYIMHASSYFGKVVRSEMKYVRGFKSGKRWRYQRLRF